MKRDGPVKTIVIDKLRSYSAALREVGATELRVTERWLNNRAENSHPLFRRRERAMLRFGRMYSLQKFAAVHSSAHNHFNDDRAPPDAKPTNRLAPPLSPSGGPSAPPRGARTCPN
jgi:putative transposase